MLTLVRVGSITGMLVLLGAGVWMISSSAFLRVRSVECSLADETECPALIVSALDTLSGTPLVFVDHQKRAAQALDAFPVSISHLEKTLSGDLSVIVQAETPSYSLIDTSGEVRYIARSGKPFTFLIDDSVSVPTIEISSQHRSLPSDFHESLVRLLNALEEFSLLPENIVWIDHNHIELRITDMREIIVVDLSSIEKTIAIIRAVQSQTEDDSSDEQYRYLDTRFELPVLRPSLEFPAK